MDQRKTFRIKTKKGSNCHPKPDITTNSTHECCPPKSSFSPSLIHPKTLLKSQNISFLYNPIHNMIIACSLIGNIDFYDAETLLPLPERDRQVLDGFITKKIFHNETDSYLFVSSLDSIYLYNASNNELKKLRKSEYLMMAVTFLEYPFFAFADSRSEKLCIGTVENDNVREIGSNLTVLSSLCYIETRNLLLLGLSSGSMRIYSLKKSGVLCSVGAEKFERAEFLFEKAIINGKEYVITSRKRDQEIKIWHFVKGKIRLLRVICLIGLIDSFVYLEKYKMIAIAWVKPNENQISFFKLFSGKLEKEFYFGEYDVRSLFLMKEKNRIGFSSGGPCRYDGGLKFVQLGQEI